MEMEFGFPINYLSVERANQLEKQLQKLRDIYYDNNPQLAADHNYVNCIERSGCATVKDNNVLLIENAELINYLRFKAKWGENNIPLQVVLGMEKPAEKSWHLSFRVGTKWMAKCPIDFVIDIVYLHIAGNYYGFMDVYYPKNKEPDNKVVFNIEANGSPDLSKIMLDIFSKIEELMGLDFYQPFVISEAANG